MAQDRLTGAARGGAWQRGISQTGTGQVSVILAGTVLAGGVLAAWRLRHRLADGHPHVHGANLGVRGDTYLAAGGFRNVAAHEDVLLRDAVRALGGIVVSTGSGPVLTSGRQRGRAPAGLAHYLRELNAQGGSIGTRAGVDAQVDVLGG